MVIWVFAGGGPSEARGLLPFLEAQFPQYTFERKFPVGFKQNPRKPRKFTGSKGTKFTEKQRANASGATGSNLAEQIRKRLTESFKFGERCDLILIFDDLDCRDADSQTEQFQATINAVEGTKNIPQIIGFAAPELESWIVADWDQVMSQYAKFKSHGVQMKLWLRENTNLSFDAPETFSEYDLAKDSCREKLSRAIQDCADKVAEEHYSKDTDTSNLIKLLNPATVMQKSAHFRKLYHALSGAMMDS